MDVLSMHIKFWDSIYSLFHIPPVLWNKTAMVEGANCYCFYSRQQGCSVQAVVSTTSCNPIMAQQLCILHMRAWRTDIGDVKNTEVIIAGRLESVIHPVVTATVHTVERMTIWVSYSGHRTCDHSCCQAEVVMTKEGWFFIRGIFTLKHGPNTRLWQPHNRGSC